ncbi:MAG: hypothetical protein K2K89_07935 [Ruminococcus sp.]|nr:hypothetical protein [Ruminococcus sp.]
MGFFDSLSGAVDRQVEKNLDYLKQKERNSSDVGLSNWWNSHQYEEGEFADKSRDIVKAEMDKRGMYY